MDWVALMYTVLVGLVGPAALYAAEAVEVSVVDDDGPAVTRQTPRGDERLLYLRITNPTGATMGGLTLQYTHEDTTGARPLIPVPSGGSWDSLWLRTPVPDRLPAKLMRGDRRVWAGTLPINKAGDDRVVVPQSETVTLDRLKPLSLRGTNYLPRHWPWPGLWREATEKTFEAEFAEMTALHINTFRTFYFFDEEAGLVRRDGALTPKLLARINTLLAVADRHGLKVMMCLTGSLPHLEELDTWRRFFRTGIEPFAYDGRILMWDLINEPGGSKGPKATVELSTWIQTMYGELEALAPNHMLTVGLCWQFDQLWELGVKPPVAQFHNYSGAVGVQPPGQPPVRNVADDLRGIQGFTNHRPLVIGEFGYATVVDEARKDASPKRQLEIYQGVLTGAQAAQITGVYNWTLFHFVPDWMGKGEQSFGVIRPDGSLKPAGELLRDTYKRWSDVVRTPWEPNLSSRG